MNKLLMTRTLVSNLRANLSTSANREGLFQTVKGLQSNQQKLQSIHRDVYIMHGADKTMFGLACVFLIAGGIWGVGRSRRLARK